MALAPLTSEEHTNLWNDFREGSREAYARIYEFFAGDLYRYGYNLVRNKELVEDCLHELFLHLHQHKSKLGATNNIRFYLYKALRHRLIDAQKRLKKYDSGQDIFDRSEFTVQPFESDLIEEQALTHQKQTVVTELNKLPKRQKEILYLVYLKGMSYQEAAEVMDISMKSVYNTINVALATLKKYVNRSFIRDGVFWTVAGSLFGLLFSNN